MNRKIITFVSAAVIPAVFLLMAIQRTTDHLMPYGQSHNLAFNATEALASLLLFPVRLYALFVYGDHGSWSLPVLILLLAMSCLIWGLIAERIIWLFSRRNAAH